ncbi:MAG: flagellin [Lachnospiraceae bacterium]|nr:flagellin [Lachnospiraceae bacterium]MDY5521455.1 flagellin [Agathobacter sp.]
MVVQHNLQAMNANRMLNVTTTQQSKATEKLSSGYKINRAADDAAGLSISEKMRKQIRGLDQASTNAQDGISAVQTAEGALTEVHSMLQRMNELAVQAANGTNSESDRTSIQDEINQLTTEIDRVAETTKFNETYLLKGNGKTSKVKIAAKDAGIEGTLKGVGTGTATFTMAALKAGDTITIGSKGYTIGTTIAAVQTAVGNVAAGKTVTIDGTEYTVVAADGKEDATENKLKAASLKALVQDGSTVVAGTQTYVAMTETAADGIGDNDASVISAKKAYDLIKDELRKASNIGTDPGSTTEASVGDAISGKNGTGTAVSGAGAYYSSTNTQVSFKITEGSREVTQGLQISLHVGADADETNKISTTIDTMDSAGLGIKGLNVVDNTGAKATYAIDSIADAVAKVSAQRSSLGAVQNRLEHTIANLDNVVENTTSAESQIRDTDMAETMVEYSKNNILAQAGQSMLAQANQSNQGVLSLLG